MIKVLIVGGSRFLGPALIKKLLENGDTIAIFNRGNNYGQIIPRKVKHIQSDRLVSKDLQKLKGDRYDYIYDMCCFNPKEAALFLKELKPKSHIIFFSSAAVYEETNIYPLN